MYKTSYLNNGSAASQNHDFNFNIVMRQTTIGNYNSSSEFTDNRC